MLVEKTMRAAREYDVKQIIVAGGVSANSGVREHLKKACEENGFEFYMPDLKWCGDNGAMIACQGYFNYMAGITADESLNGVATLSLENL